MVEISPYVPPLVEVPLSNQLYHDFFKKYENSNSSTAPHGNIIHLSESHKAGT
jgi:hypothetical protein